MPLASMARTPWLEVHRVDLDDPAVDVALARACLDADERARADRGTALVRRHRTVLRAALRLVVSRLLGCSPAELPLTTTQLGRPVLADDPGRVDFSCSRRGGTGLVAVARGARVGVDVERVQPWVEGTESEGWLSVAEVSALLALPAADRPRAAARSWAEKEAVLKAIGTGLRTPPACVPTTPGQPSDRIAGWTVVPVPLTAGFEAAVATSRPLPTGRAPVTPSTLTNWTARLTDDPR